MITASSPAVATATANKPKKPIKPPGAAASAAQCAWLLGISEASWWRWNKERADVPRPRKIGPKATRWITSEVLAFRDRSVGGPA